MAHTFFIALHAAAGVLAFMAGLGTVRWPRLFTTYLSALAVMAVALLAAVLLGWADLATGGRILFGAFVALAAYMIVRGVQARGTRPVPDRAPSTAYVEHLGFTLVALFDGFAVVTALNLTGSGWWAGGVGVVGAVVGNRLIVAARRRLCAQTTPERTA